jgi:hypothetical protein
MTIFRLISPALRSALIMTAGLALIVTAVTRYSASAA